MTAFDKSDVRHQPAYTLAEAARYLKLPQATLRACAVAFMDGASATLVATVDGSEVQDIPGYRVQSPLFSFSAPADNVLFVPGPVSGQSVSDGYWIFLAPLSTGTHTIHFEGNPGFPIDVTYVLTVGR